MLNPDIFCSNKSNTSDPLVIYILRPYADTKKYVLRHPDLKDLLYVPSPSHLSIFKSKSKSGQNWT